MVYDEPIFRPLGDCYLAVEFGDEANLALNFRALALARALEEEDLDGVVEVLPTMRELAIVLDRRRTTQREVRAVVERHLEAVTVTEQLPSRLLRIPVWYDDPWSAEIAKRYGVQKNIDFVADVNGITPDEVIEFHTGTDYWVVCVAFTPGCYHSYAVDMSKELTAPKYKTPRSHTPARALSLAGLCTAAYPVASPGGYQLIGRLAVNIFEAVPKNAAFPPDGVLLRAGDRHRYYNVDALEYEEIWNQVERGEYEYEITEELFDVNTHLETRASRRIEVAEAAASGGGGRGSR